MRFSLKKYYYMAFIRLRMFFQGMHWGSWSGSNAMIIVEVWLLAIIFSVVFIGLKFFGIAVRSVHPAMVIGFILLFGFVNDFALKNQRNVEHFENEFENMPSEKKRRFGYSLVLLLISVIPLLVFTVVYDPPK